MVGAKKIQTGFLPREDRDKLTNALERLVEAQLYVDDTPGLSLTEMRAKARRLRQSVRRPRSHRHRLPAADDRGHHGSGSEAL